MLALLPIAVVVYGGVHHPSRIGLAAAMLAIGWGLFARSRYDGGRAIGLLVVAALAIAAMPLIPVGEGIRRVFMGTLAGPVEAVVALTGEATRPLALVPWKGLLGWSEAVGFAMLALGIAGWSTRAGRNRRLLWSVVGSGLVVVATMMIHNGLGLNSIYGMGLGEGNRDGFFAPFVNPNHGGIFLAAMVPLCVARSVNGRAMERTTAALSGGLCAFGVWASGSRGAVVALAVGLAVAIAAGGGKRSRMMVGTGGLGAAIAAVALGPQRVLELLSNWVAPSVTAMADAGYVSLLTGRGTLAKASIELAAEVPVLGVGAGGFAEALRMVRDDTAFNSAAHAHNEYLQSLVEHGVIAPVLGFVALMSIVRIGVGALSAWSERPDRRWLIAGWLGTVAVLAVAATVDFPMRLHSHAILAAFATGSLVGLARRHRGGHRPSRVAWGVASTGTVLALMALAAVVHGGAGPWSNPNSAQAAGEGWMSAYADGRERSGALDAAAAHFERAANRGLRRHSFQWLARVRALQGQPEAADRVLEIGTQLDPTMPWLWRDRARLAQRTGDAELARRAWSAMLALDLPATVTPTDVVREALFGGAFESPIAQARAILPERPDRYRQAARVMDQLGLREESETLFRRALSMSPTDVNSYAKALMKWGRPHDAVMLLEPNLTGCFSHRAYAKGLLQLGRYTDAANAFQAAIGACGAGVWELRSGVCMARLLSGDPRGEDAVEGLLKERPASHRLRRAWLWILSRRGRTVDGVRHLSALKDAGVIRPKERVALQRAEQGLPFRIAEPAWGARNPTGASALENRVQEEP
ncbi:MAG: O-antigen ligase family protein [Myxococcota bacterium]|nr:O-antigen ligase family protein [Myxococcota bacterium]